VFVLWLSMPFATFLSLDSFAQNTQKQNEMLNSARRCSPMPRTRIENIEEVAMVRKFVVILLALGAMARFAEAQSSDSAAASAPVASDAAAVPANDVKAVLEQVQTVIRSQAQQLESQRRQIERQQVEIEALRREIEAARPATAPDAEQEQTAAAAAARLNSETNALRTTSNPASAAQPALQPAAVAQQSAPQGTGTKSSDGPLSIRFGQGSLTPGGWVDFTAYYRSTDVGSGLGTAFGAIPFNNTVLGGLSETRFTAQSSRISLRADETFGATKVFGYGEADFNGYLPSNAYVSTNSDTLRLRVYFTDLSRGRWELLGGQSWSLLTPNRVGVSPFLSEIYNTMHLDTNYQAGLTYARQAQLRAVYHITGNVALGLSAE